MKPVFVPNYYHSFRCTAAACRHTCCVGWEIDVDGEALARYDALDGEMGKRLRTCIDREADPPCFILTADERCPFLNRNGLCDLITELGEESLCHICADHPRFRNILPDRVELGLGLCCEAAAELILSQTELTQLTELSPDRAARERYAREPAEENESDIRLALCLRENLLRVAQNRRYTLSERVDCIRRILGYDRLLPPMSYAQWSELLRETEELDPARRVCFDALATLREEPEEELSAETGLPYEKLLCYFLYRYVAALRYDFDEWRLSTRVRFAVLATTLIHAMARATGGKTTADICEVARIFSSEMEYSEENLACLWDILEAY